MSSGHQYGRSLFFISSTKKYSMPLSQEIRAKIVALKQHTTKSNREISNDLRIPRRTVDGIVRTWQSGKSLIPYNGAPMGRKEKLTAREKSAIVREAKKDPSLSSSEIKYITGEIGEKVTSRTIRNILNSVGLKVYRPIKKPLLTDDHKRKRYQWAKVHRSWTLEDWGKVREFVIIRLN
jgi:transposase